MLKNDKGQGLLSVLLVISILVIYFSNLNIQKIKKINTIITDTEINIIKKNLEYSITKNLSSPINCFNHFGTKTLPLSTVSKINIDQIHSQNHHLLVESNSRFNRLDIKQIHLHNLDIPNLNSSGHAQLIIPILNTSNKTTLIRIPLKTSLDMSGTITKCYADSIYKIGENRNSSFDFFNANRDGWVCSCSEEPSTSQEVVSTLCTLAENNKITNIWKPFSCPWTCKGPSLPGCPNSPPNPPGSLPVLRYTRTHIDHSALPNKTRFNCLDTTSNWVSCSTP